MQLTGLTGLCPLVWQKTKRSYVYKTMYSSKCSHQNFHVLSLDSRILLFYSKFLTRRIYLTVIPWFIEDVVLMTSHAFTSELGRES